MKVKIFTNRRPEDLEKEVNSFLDRINIKVIDIKYSSSDQFSEVFVMYEEIKV